MEHDIVIAGAGLAGLAAAASAARAGARVLVLDEKSPGGRARTEEQDGFRFNRGPHAIALGGPGRKILARLDVRPAVHTPPLRGARLSLEGQLHPALSRRFVGLRAAAQLTTIFTRIFRTDQADWPVTSTRDWIDSLDLTPKAAAMMEFTARVATYAADTGSLPADVVFAQLRNAAKFVGYPDEGWQALVDGLVVSAKRAGAEIRGHAPVTAIDGEPGAWRVRTMSGQEITAGAVVVATGTPAGTRRLLPDCVNKRDTDWYGSMSDSLASPSGMHRGDPGSGVSPGKHYGSDPEGVVPPGDNCLGPEVTAACLDLGVRHTRTRLAFGIDEPLYLSPHAPGGHLAPEGMGMVHVARYGASAPDADRARLEAFAASAGIAPGDIATSRFLPSMSVVTAMPAVGRGIAGRPPVAVPAAPGLFVAGDWVGPVGWLADTSLVSGERAGLLAAEAVTRDGQRVAA